LAERGGEQPLAMLPWPMAVAVAPVALAAWPVAVALAPVATLP
jgi:hypothetical protein